MRKRLLSIMMALYVVFIMLPISASATESGVDESSMTIAKNVEKQQISLPNGEIFEAEEEITSEAQYGEMEIEAKSKMEETARTAVQRIVEKTGNCGANGDNVSWVLNSSSGMLIISGEGAMANYTIEEKAPWSSSIGSIKTIIIQDGVTSIGNFAFHSCRKLENINIADSVQSIGDYAIWGNSLKNIHIPVGVTNIGKAAFATDAIVLTQISVDEGNTMFIAENDVLFNHDKTELIRYPVGKKDQIYTIPDGVTSIAYEAFFRGIYLKDIKIPNGISVISGYAFGGCTNITKMVIPYGTTTIGECAFAKCNNLSSVSLPDSINELDLGVFYSCTKLTDVNIPNRLVRIKLSTFAECSSLAKISIPISVTYIEEKAFLGCNSLISVEIPGSVARIGSGAFANCESLKDIYYGSTKSKWNFIDKTDNKIFDTTDITIHCTDGDIKTNTEYKVYCNGGYEKFDISLENCMNGAKNIDANGYNPQLAHMLIAMCNSVYSKEDMKKTFESFGFENPIADNRKDSIFLGYGMAKKQVGDKTLVLIVAEGTGTLSDDWQGWASNVFDSGLNNDKLHRGLADAAKELYKRMTSIEYLGVTDFSNVSFVLTGFSRGAAAANILAARLIEKEGVPEENIYAYTFSCPDVGTAPWKTVNNPYQCIFNIGNVNDVVSWVPGGVWEGFSNWDKYGRSYWYCKDWDSSQNEMGMDAHNQAKYMEDLRLELPTSEYRTRESAKAALESAKAARKAALEAAEADRKAALEAAEKRLQETLKGRFPDPFPAPNITTYAGCHCPVDVEIRTTDGKVAGTVINNIPNEIMPDKVYIDVNGEQKNIFLLDNDQYVINLTGTGEGTMKYFVKNIDINSWETLEEKTFANVNIINAKKMITYINTSSDESGGADVSNVQLFTLDTNGQPEKEVLPDGNGTEIPVESPDDPGTEPDMLPFVDVNQADWYYDPAKFVFSRKIMTGMDNTHFGPGGLLSRAQFATILYRMEGSPKTAYNAGAFPDVMDGEFFTSPAMWAKSTGVITGYADGSFGPADDITREQMAVMMYRYAGMLKLDTSVRGDLGSFPDGSSVSGFAQEAMAWAVGEELIRGDSGKINPQGKAERGQCATIIMRYMQKYGL